MRVCAETDWEAAATMRELRANTSTNQKTVQGVQTPRWRRVESAARKAKAGQVGFRPQVETRFFQELQAPHMISHHDREGHEGNELVLVDVDEAAASHRGDRSGGTGTNDPMPSSRSGINSASGRFESLKETSDHRTLGGKEEWARKRHRNLHESNRLQLSRMNGTGTGGIMSPWKFMTPGNKKDESKDDVSVLQLPLVPSSNPNTPRPASILRGAVKPAFEGERAETPPLQSPVNGQGRNAKSSSPISPRDAQHQSDRSQDHPGVLRDEDDEHRKDGGAKVRQRDSEHKIAPQPGGLLKRTLSNPNALQADEKTDNAPSPSRGLTAGLFSLSRTKSNEPSSAARPSGSVPAARATSGLMSRTGSNSSSENGLYDSGTAIEKAVRKPTRVMANKDRTPKKESNLGSMVTLGAGERKQSSIQAPEGTIQDELGGLQGPDERAPPDLSSNASQDHSLQDVSAEGEGAEVIVDVRTDDRTGQGVENVASGSEVRKRREGGKKLGWGDKKPPPLNYKPWYSIFTW